MDFRKLSFFESVCRLHSFTKASMELHVTQPSVTIAIQNLEEELGVRLLDRHRGGFSLTPEGEFLFEKAKQILKDLEDVTLELRLSSRLKIDILRIGYSVQMRAAVTELLRGFRERQGNIKVIESESSTPSIVRQLEEGMMDLGIVAATREMSKSMDVYPLFEGELRVCASRDNPISQRESISLDLFEQQPLISLSLNEPKNSYIFNVLQEAYPNRRIAIKPMFSHLQLSSYFQSIRNNDGIGLTYHDRWFSAEQYARTSAEHGCYVALPFSPPCVYTVAVIMPKGKMPGKAQSDFLEYVKSDL